MIDKKPVLISVGISVAGLLIISASVGSLFPLGAGLAIIGLFGAIMSPMLF